MQFHYVVFYDTDKKKWFVEDDPYAYFGDGNVWDEERYQNRDWGWVVPEDDSEAALLDQTLLNTLHYMTDIIPVPEEVA